jgi:hypothetical protein
VRQQRRLPDRFCIHSIDDRFASTGMMRRRSK